jgi:hypothetical protein
MKQAILILRVLFIISATTLAIGSRAQSADVSIEQTYDVLTEKWLAVSENLKHYEGLSSFCLTPEYRKYASEILTMLHHYDSVVLAFLLEPGTEAIIGHQEYKRTLTEIEEFETKYDIKSFMLFLRESCVTRNDLEKNKKTLQLDFGMYGYDGQITVLEADLTKFLNHIDKRVVSIDTHLHRIHPDRFQFSGVLSQND